MEKITEGIYANVDWDGGNVACIDTPEGIVMVDTPIWPGPIEQCKKFIHDLNPKGIKYIINTHIHFDHIIGNNQLGGPVIMHEKMRENLYKENSTLRETFVPATPGLTQEEIDFILGEPLVSSEITVTSDLTLHMGDKTLKIFHGGGHTPDSIVVYVEEDQVLITGDIVTSGLHPGGAFACFSDWIKALQRLKTLEIKTVIPGHGTICGAEAIDRLEEYFQKMWDRASDLVSQNRSKDEVVETIREEMFTFFDVDPEMIGGAKILFDMGTRQLYKEINSS